MMDPAALLAALPLPVLTCDGGRRVTFLNPTAEEWLGLSARQAAGRGVAQLVQLDDALLRRAEAGERVSAYGAWNIHAAPLDDGGLLLVIDAPPHPDDIHSAQQEAARTAGLMAAMLAHEVKNPLAGIRGAAQLLAREMPESARPLAELICAEVDRIGGVLARVEPFSEEAAVAPPLNIHEALRYAIEVARAGFPLAVEERYDPSLPEVAAMHGALVQIVLNLAKNAYEAGAKRLVLTTAYSFDHQLPVALTVEDDGSGIGSEMRARLFEPFASGKGAGRGLGLAVSAKLASGMGGRLTLEESRPGCTRFRLALRTA